MRLFPRRKRFRRIGVSLLIVAGVSAIGSFLLADVSETLYDTLTAIMFSALVFGLFFVLATPGSAAFHHPEMGMVILPDYRSDFDGIDQQETDFSQPDLDCGASDIVFGKSLDFLKSKADRDEE